MRRGLQMLIDWFRSIVLRGNEQEPSNSHQRRIICEEEEEQIKFETTCCLSSYYSIFVARLAIMIMLAILIGMLTMLTWHFTKSYTKDTINSLAYGLRHELLQRPILRMWNILNSTVEITMAQVKLSEYVIDRHDKPSQAERDELYNVMRDVTWALFSSRKALNAITISYRNGFVQAFHRDHRSNNTFYIYSDHVKPTMSENRPKDRNTSSIWYRESLDPITGEKIGTRRPIPPDDLINIAGLSEVRDGSASWHVAVSKFTDSPLLSAALPVRRLSDRRIVAAVGVTTALYSVGQLMKELVRYHSGYMYLTSQEGYVLATSTEAPLLRNSTTGRKLMMAVDSEDPMIRSGAEWLNKAYGDKFPINTEVHAEDVMLGHHKYYIDSFFLNLKRLPLVGVIIIPRKYIMGKVDQIGFTTLVILIAASICTLAIGCVCILILTSGISKEMRLRAELISQLDARRRAEASSNCKSQFLANMSHELRTPMAAVIGLLDILMCDDYLSTEQFATITQIRKCSTALLHLLNNILDLSKVESGKLLLEEAEFDIGKELEGIVDMFSAQCINHNVEIVLELSDDMPILVHGDSARVVQIFTNLISNSIKFTSSGHIILRGWCENYDTSGITKLSTSQNKPHCLFKRKSKPRECIMNNDKKSNRKIILWFEVDDTGCGIDPSKWESVFESFEQADPSTTRTHGGTGLGLCIVRNLVTKMGGEIKVVQKDGSGTLMQLYLVLGMPLEGTGMQFHLDFCNHNFMVLLALKGSMGRLMMSQWLRQNGVYASLASEWNELAQILQETFQGKQCDNKDFVECSTHKAAKLFPRDITRKMETPNIVVVDADILDLSSNIWRQQLYFLDNYHAKAKFAWILNHDTSSEIKFELQRKGHLLIVNKPLYKTKMIQILKTVIQEKKHMRGIKTPIHDVHEFFDTDPIQFNVISDNSDVSDSESWEQRNGSFPDEERNKKVYPHKTANSRKEIPHSVHPDSVLQDTDSSPQAGNFPNSSKNSVTSENYRNDCRNNHMQCNPTEIISFMNQGNVLVDSNQECFQDELKVSSTMYEIKQMKSKPMERETASTELPARQMNMQISGGSLSNIPCGRPEFNARQAIINYPKAKDPVTRVKAISEQNSLSGLRILLAEDTPVLQRVATIMLEKMGATVTAVGDGMQVVDALKCMLGTGECLTMPSEQKNGMLECQTQGNHAFDLILMDCQMPKLDGYDTTKAIRRFEAGTGSHIPIVALTAHAMSSDETKCLEVGMDAYLTKPIDCELMVSTILSFTDKRVS